MSNGEESKERLGFSLFGLARRFYGGSNPMVNNVNNVNNVNDVNANTVDVPTVTSKSRQNSFRPVAKLSPIASRSKSLIRKRKHLPSNATRVAQYKKRILSPSFESTNANNSVNIKVPKETDKEGRSFEQFAPRRRSQSLFVEDEDEDEDEDVSDEHKEDENQDETRDGKASNHTNHSKHETVLAGYEVDDRLEKRSIKSKVGSLFVEDSSDNQKNEDSPAETLQNRTTNGKSQFQFTEYVSDDQEDGSSEDEDFGHSLNNHNVNSASKTWPADKKMSDVVRYEKSEDADMEAVGDADGESSAGDMIQENDGLYLNEIPEEVIQQARRLEQEEEEQYENEDSDIPQEITIDDFEIATRIRNNVLETMNKGQKPKKKPHEDPISDVPVTNGGGSEFSSSNNSTIISPESIEVISLISDSDESKSFDGEMLDEDSEESDYTIPPGKSSIRNLIARKKQLEQPHSNSKSRSSSISSYNSNSSLFLSPSSPRQFSITKAKSIPSPVTNTNNNAFRNIRESMKAKQHSPVISSKSNESHVATNVNGSINNSVTPRSDGDEDVIDYIIHSSLSIPQKQISKTKELKNLFDENDFSNHSESINTTSSMDKTNKTISQTIAKDPKSVNGYQSFYSPHSYQENTFDDIRKIIDNKPDGEVKSVLQVNNSIESVKTPTKNVQSSQSHSKSVQSTGSIQRRVSISQTLSPSSVRRHNLEDLMPQSISRAEILEMARGYALVDPDDDQDQYNSDDFPYSPKAKKKPGRPRKKVNEEAASKPRKKNVRTKNARTTVGRPRRTGPTKNLNNEIPSNSPKVNETDSDEKLEKGSGFHFTSVGKEKDKDIQSGDESQNGRHKEIEYEKEKQIEHEIQKEGKQVNNNNGVDRTSVVEFTTFSDKDLFVPDPSSRSHGASSFVSTPKDKHFVEEDDARGDAEEEAADDDKPVRSGSNDFVFETDDELVYGSPDDQYAFLNIAEQELETRKTQPRSTKLNRKRRDARKRKAIRGYIKQNNSRAANLPAHDHNRYNIGDKEAVGEESV